MSSQARSFWASSPTHRCFDRGGTMLAVIAKVKVKLSEVERFSRFLEADVEGSLREPGCLRFDVLRDESDPTVFYLYEVYRDRAAFDLHQKQPYFTAFAT